MTMNTAYDEISYWLADSADDLTPRPPLRRPQDYDVAILGAGYSGLWTAYYLLQRDPSLRVAVLEAEIAGFGGSGRNGGWCNATMMGLSVGGLVRRFGKKDACAILESLRGRVDEIGSVCERERIDACYRKSGVIRLARGRHELPALKAQWGALEEVGLTKGVQRLSRKEVFERVKVARAEGGIFDPNVAWIHPGRLVRGLARAVERRGAVIYERTKVTRIHPGASPEFETPYGNVKAGVLVLAGEAYLTKLPSMRRRLIPLYSLVVLTQPLNPAQWDAIGWRNGEGLSSSRLSVDYVSKSHDGRILFGGRGAPYHYACRIRREYDYDEGIHNMLRNLLRDWFPTLQDIDFEYAWGGPLGMPRDWTPNIYYDRVQNVAGAYGYTGQGVAPSNLAGNILADLITGADTRKSRLPIVGHRSRPWEPEPLRWTAIRYMQSALLKLDARGERTGKPPTGRSLAERVTRH